jgi:hypothetical protein
LPGTSLGIVIKTLEDLPGPVAGRGLHYLIAASYDPV